MKPIIMSAESVRAILDGRKTQTRRVIKPQPWWIEVPHETGGVWVGRYSHDENIINPLQEARCPYTVGQRLWVREKWRPVYMTPRPRTEELSVVQYADGSFNRDDWGGCKVGETWRSPIFMPRAFSRITLEVTGVRTERVQDIDNCGAIAEGVPPPRMEPCGAESHDSVQVYLEWWDKLNPKHPWASNPWVWVVEFAVAGGDR